MRLPSDFALISLDNRIDFKDVQRIAASVHQQLTTDFYHKWGRYIEMHAYQHEADAPVHLWRVYLQNGLDEPGALGYHTTIHGQPVAYVDSSSGRIEEISVTVSHEALESAADSYGNKLLTMLHPVNNKENVRVLLELCDPPEAVSYVVNGLPVSDFLLPEWYDAKATGIPYTFRNSIKTPRTLIRGGYVSFIDSHGRGWQQTFFSGNAPKLVGPFAWTVSGGQSLREQIDAQTAINKAAEADSGAPETPDSSE